MKEPRRKLRYADQRKCPVAIGGDGHAVGNKEHGLVGKMVGKALHQEAFGCFVEGGTELIKKEERAFPEQGAGDGDALGLPFAQSASCLLAKRVESFGKGIDEIGYGGMEGMAYFLLCSRWISDQEVTAYRTAQQAVPLGYIDQVTAGSGRYGNLLHRIVEIKMALSRRQQGEDEAKERAFPGTGLTQDSGTRTGREVVGEMG